MRLLQGIPITHKKSSKTVRIGKSAYFSIPKVPYERLNHPKGGRGSGIRKSLDLSCCHIKVLAKTMPKWAQPPLNSKQLTFYRNLNICKFGASCKGYYGKKEKITKKIISLHQFSHFS